MNNKLSVFCDGGSRGNPGEAAYGFVVYGPNNNKLYEEGKILGIQTNNYAEYTAVIASMKWLLKNTQIKSQIIHYFLDSKLAVEQLSGNWKVKSESIRELFLCVKSYERKLDTKILYSHVPREQNKEADRMVNLALDNKI